MSRASTWGGLHAGGAAGTVVGKPAGRGVFALLLATTLALVSITCVPTAAHAHGGLSLGLRIQQEFYKPLVPVARNFKTCFKTDPATGVQVMSFCAEAPTAMPVPVTTSAPERVPAHEPNRIPAGAQNVRPNARPSSHERPAHPQPIIRKVRKK